MKKLNALLIPLIAACAFCFLSCDDKEVDPNTNASLKLSTDKVNISSAGGSDEVIVTAFPSWNHDVSDKSWFEVTAQDGKIIVSAPANGGDQTKTTVVTVTAGDKTESFTVTQRKAGDGEVLEVDNAAINFTYNDTKSVKREVVTDAESWKATPSVVWIKVSESSSSFTITVTENPTSRKRSGQITVQAGQAEDVVINITQDQSPNAFGAFEGIFTGTADGYWDGPTTWTSEVVWAVTESDEYLGISNFGGAEVPIFADYLRNNEFTLDYFHPYSFKFQGYDVKVVFGLVFVVKYPVQDEETGEWSEEDQFVFFDPEETGPYTALYYDYDDKVFTVNKYDYVSVDDKTYPIYYVHNLYLASNNTYISAWNDLYEDFTLTKVADRPEDARSMESNTRRDNCVEKPVQERKVNAKMERFDPARLILK